MAKKNHTAPLRRKAHECANKFSDRTGVSATTRDVMYSSYYEGYMAGHLAADRKHNPPKPNHWIDGGYLDNSHCPFMLGSMDGPCCRLPHGHSGQHRTDSQP
jgi:hypothetical protein